VGNTRRGFEIQIYHFFFIFFIIFHIFFISPMYSCQKFCKLLWCFLVWVRDLSKNSTKSWISFLKIEILYLFWAINRCNRVDTTSVESHNWCSISSWVLLGLVFYISDLFLLNVFLNIIQTTISCISNKGLQYKH